MTNSYLINEEPAVQAAGFLRFETIMNRKHRDFVVDANGTVIEVEDKTAIDKIPGAAKAVIEKKAAGGKREWKP